MSINWAYEQQKDRIRREKSLHTLLNVLRAIHVTSVTARYDGSGDQGEIVSVSGTVNGKRVADLRPDLDRPLALTERDSEAESIVQGLAGTRLQTIDDALEEALLDALESSHPGWEINSGSRGEVSLDVASGTIDITYRANEEYEEYED